MRPPVIRIHSDELVVDNFAGGGGASLGIEWALGRSPDIAVNHDPEAVAMHAANHPSTRHFCEDVWKVDPKVACGGKRVALAWFSPDCKHFSKAKGGKPVDKNIRGLAWVVTRWAKAVKPRVIVLENVEEFQDWGPLLDDGKPCPIRRGLTFRRWLGVLRNCGYEVEVRELRACDYGAPTSRKRLFIIARSDGLPIIWPEPTHGPALEPYLTAAHCIEWAIPCPSIFDRKRPLAENTMRRIARGLRRYVIEAAEPFIIPVAHAGDARVHSINEPLRTVTGAHRGEHALVTPYLAGVGGRKGQSPETPVDQPYHTITAKGDTAIVAPYLARLAQTGGNGKYTNDVREPLTTLVSKAEHLLLEPFLVRTAHGEQDATGKRRGRGEHSLGDPLPTVLASNDFALTAPTLIQQSWGERPGQAPRCLDLHKPLGTVVGGGIKHALVSAFIARHYGGNFEGPGVSPEVPLPTVTSRDHHALVASHLVKLRGGLADHQNTAQDLRTPAPTITASGNHLAEVRAFLVTYYTTGEQDGQLGLPMHTVTSKARFGLVTVQGVEYVIADIGMRMLAPRELFRAQGFPDSYRIQIPVDGKPLSKEAQVRMVGNSVCPPIAAAIVAANFAVAERAEEVA